MGNIRHLLSLIVLKIYKIKYFLFSRKAFHKKQQSQTNAQLKNSSKQTNGKINKTFITHVIEALF